MIAARVELALRGIIWRTIWYALVWKRLYRGPYILRSLAAWGLGHVGGWAYSPRSCDLQDRLRR